MNKPKVIIEFSSSVATARMSPKLQQVLEEAKRIAQDHCSASVSLIHLFLAMMNVNCKAFLVISEICGAEERVSALRRTVARNLPKGIGKKSIQDDLPFDSELKAALSAAMECGNAPITSALVLILMCDYHLCPEMAIILERHSFNHRVVTGVVGQME